MNVRKLLKILQLATASRDQTRYDGQLQHIHLDARNRDNLILFVTDGHMLIKISGKNLVTYHELRAYFHYTYGFPLLPEIPVTGQIALPKSRDKIPPYFETEKKYPEYEKLIPEKLQSFRNKPCIYSIGFDANVRIQKIYKILNIRWTHAFIPEMYQDIKDGKNNQIGMMVRILSDDIFIGVMPCKVFV